MATTQVQDSICFTDVQGGGVFRLATWENNELVMQSDPFLVEKVKAPIKFFTSGGEKEVITLFYKYDIEREGLCKRMVGCTIEGSMYEDFRITDTLYLITDPPSRLYTAVEILNDQKYRYIRYKGKDGTYCNISELSLYDSFIDTEPLKGRPIGTPGCFQHDCTHEFSNVFDGDPYTSFDFMHPEGGWTGLDLNIPKVIRKAIYTPRNRDNFIRKGDLYELFYWQNRAWQSAGQQYADSDALLYEVPAETLLYLRNYTRGKEERIFEYVKGKQIFW